MIVTSIYDLWLKVMIEKRAEWPPLGLDDLPIASGSIWIEASAALAAKQSRVHHPPDRVHCSLL
jgi:hypothetical protein